MKIMNVITGYGYIADKDGNIINRYILPVGEHLIRDDQVQIELSSLEELEEVKAPKPQESPRSIRNKKIHDEMFRMAEDNLKKRGEIE
jgi:hypothetical protein